MNAVTLNSMAFDHFETVVEDYLAGVEGEGLLGAVAYGLCQGAVGGISGFGAGLGARHCIGASFSAYGSRSSPLANWSWDYCRCCGWIGTGIR